MGQGASVALEATPPSTPTFAELLRKVNDGGQPAAETFFSSLLSLDEVRALFSRDHLLSVSADQAAGVLGTAEVVLRERQCTTPADRLRLLVCTQTVSSITLVLLDSQSASEVERLFLSGHGRCRQCFRDTQPDWKCCPFCETRLPPQSGASLASRLFGALAALLFVPGFTLPDGSSDASASQRPWPPHESALAPTIAQARHTVVRALLVLLSQPLRCAPSNERALRRACEWQSLLHVTLGDGGIEAFFFSLLNCGLMGRPAATSGGFFGGGPRDESLRLALCATHLTMVLCNSLLSDYSTTAPVLLSSSSSSSAPLLSASTTQQPARSSGAFIDLLRAYAENYRGNFGVAIVDLLQSKAWRHCLACPFAGALTHPQESMPRGLCFVWFLLNECPSFVQAQIATGDGSFVRALLVPVCETIQSALTTPGAPAGAASVGTDAVVSGANESLVNLAVLIVLSLSAHRSFAVTLNAQLSVAERARFVTYFRKEPTASFADLLIVVVADALMGASFAELHEYLVTIMANVLPFQKNLTMTAAVQTMKLFVRVSSKTGLVRNPQLVELVLDCIANVLQFQFEANRPFVYALVQYRDKLERFASLCADGALDMEPFEAKLAAHQRTLKWFHGVRKQLRELQSLRTIVRVLHEIVPKLERCFTNSSEVIMQELGKMTVVGILPPSKPIVMRRSQRSKETDLWVLAFVWSVVAMEEHEKLSLLPTPPLFAGE